MKLSIKDRMSIVQMLPQSSSLTEMVDILDIVKKVKIYKEEMDRIQYEEMDGRITWNPSLEVELDVELTFEQIKILKESVSRLDREKKVNPSNLDICLKINSL